MWWPDHFGLVASDLDRTVDFYSVVLDRPPLERVVWEGEDAEYVADMLASPGLTLRAAFFELPYSPTVLEIIEYSNLDRPEASGLAPTMVGATHIGFYVESVDEAAKRLATGGISFIAPPVDIPYGPYRGGRTAYFRDPDGVNLQLMEVHSRPGSVPVLRRSEPVPEYATE